MKGFTELRETAALRELYCILPAEVVEAPDHRQQYTPAWFARAVEEIKPTLEQPHTLHLIALHNDAAVTLHQDGLGRRVVWVDSSNDRRLYLFRIKRGLPLEPHKGET